jgi:desampylase
MAKMPQISTELLARLLAEAERTAPRECCGLLLGRGDRIEALNPARNVAADPLHRFEIDPETLLAAHKAARAGGPEVIGYYHSHPSGEPVPSARDREEAGGDRRLWAIVAAGRVGFWRDGERGFEAEPTQVIGA